MWRILEGSHGFHEEGGEGSVVANRVQKGGLSKNCQRHPAENSPGIQCPASRPLRISSLTNFIT